MPINFPTSLDDFTNPTGTDEVATVDHAEQHSNVNDAIEALQAKVGIDGSADTDSHDYKLANPISWLPKPKDTRAVFPLAIFSSNDLQTSLSSGNAVMILYPVFLRKDTTYTEVNIQQNASTGGGNSRIMIYKSGTKGGAGLLAQDCGEVATTSAGTKNLAISFTPTEDGIYWIGKQDQYSGNTFWSGKYCTGAFVGGASSPTHYNAAGYRYSNTYTNGAPADLTDTAATTESYALFITIEGAYNG